MTNNAEEILQNWITLPCHGSLVTWALSCENL